MWKFWRKSKNNNTLILSDSFVTFLKNRYKDKGHCVSHLSYEVGDGLYLNVELKIYQEKGEN